MITHIKRQINWVVKIVAVFSLLYLLVVPVMISQAQEAEEEEEIIIVMKEVSGEVGAISSSLITIIYNRDEEKKIEYEIDLPIDKDIRIVHKRRLSDISIGDIVRVKYEERQKEEQIQKEGIAETKTKVIGRKAKVVTFIRPKVQQ